jgi:bacterioferritin (cytochrome b1)
LLRAELTAVHQQFLHMLALRQWKEQELLAQITAVDMEDFKNAMQIMELLVSRGTPIELPGQTISPGWDITSIVHSELRMEKHLANVLLTIQVDDPAERQRVTRAAAPREAYRAWLEARLRVLEPQSAAPQTNSAIALLLSHLVHLVEQAMLHAFLNWHSNDADSSNNAWRLSGAAMLYATALVRQGASTHGLPAPGDVPAVRMGQNTPEAFALDMHAVAECADVALQAIEAAPDNATSSICERIAEACGSISNMEMGGEFPETFGRSPVFDSFAATRERHLV